eukprot:gene23647-32019_t
MSYNGYEYSKGGGGGSFGGGYGFDPMGVFDGGAIGGGGFLAEERAGGKGSDKKASRDKNSLIPLSIRQLVTATHEDDSYKVDGAELANIKIMGMVAAIEEHSTNFNFKVNDGTGVMDCKQWIDRDTRAQSKLTGLRDGALVRVVGNLREFDGKVHLLVFDVTPVLDWNELSYHLLDIMLTHCQQTKGSIPGTAQGNSYSHAIGSPMVTVPPSSSYGASNKQQQYQNQPSGGSNGNHSMAAIVLGVYKEMDRGSAIGIAMTDVLEALHRRGTALRMNQLEKEVSQLCDDGTLKVAVWENKILLMGEFDGESVFDLNVGPVATDIALLAYETKFSISEALSIPFFASATGGYHGHTQLNDVWASADGGYSWIQVCQNAQWHCRQGHTTVVLDNLIGGFGGSSRFNDMWKSSDAALVMSAVRPFNPEAVTDKAAAPSQSEWQIDSGVAFQSISEEDIENIGYVVPVNVINHFLNDVKANGKVSGVSGLGVKLQGMDLMLSNDFRKYGKSWFSVQSRQATSPLHSYSAMLKRDLQSQYRPLSLPIIVEALWGRNRDEDLLNSGRESRIQSLDGIGIEILPHCSSSSEGHELPLLCGSPKEAWPVSLALELEISQSKSDSARKETFYWVKNKEIVQIDKLDNLGELACKNGSRLINSVLHQNNLKVKNMQSMAGQGRLYLQCTALAEFPARVSYFDQRESGIGERAATARERADRMRKLRFPSQSTAQALTEFRPG